ncbi:NUDIX hydrolase domain-like protein [Hyaloraphidium curvatum]|nr:NUDIX hydrolase domain-like protein [Hyaloraphidium curvatum]
MAPSDASAGGPGGTGGANGNGEVPRTAPRAVPAEAEPPAGRGSGPTPPTDAVDDALELHEPVQDVYLPPTHFYYSRFAPKSDLAKFLPAVPEALRPAVLALAAHEPPVDDNGLTDRRAAVCVAVHVTDSPPHAVARGDPPQRLEVWLTRRSARLRTHSGEVALPGGRVDKEDRDAVHAALREAHEEIGLPPMLCLYLTQLPPTLSRQGLLVTPVVVLLVHNLDPARKRRPFAPVPNPDEVASVFSVPLDLFLRSRGHGHRDMDWQDTGWRMRSHFWDYDVAARDGAEPAPGAAEPPGFPRRSIAEGGEFIFGLTAGIMLSVARLAMPDFTVEFTIDRPGAPSEEERIAFLRNGGKFAPVPPVVVKEDAPAPKL